MRRLFQWFLALFITGTESPKEKKKVQRQKRSHNGVHYYMGDLLGGLDRYFEIIRAMKGQDIDDYESFTRLGAPVCDVKNLLFHNKIQPSVRSGMTPTWFGAHINISGAADGRTDNFYPDFISFSKMKFITDCQFTNRGEIYRASMYWGRRKDKKLIIQQFPIAVTPDGDVEVLRTYSVQRLGRRRDIPVGRWTVPPPLKDLYDEVKGEKGDWADLIKSPTDLARILFAHTHGIWDESQRGLQVRVKKSGITATFSIDQLRTPYFFKDRIKTKTKSGRTKPIFHIVRTHQRKTGEFVRSHYRGMRRFAWNGYDVNIVLPTRSFMGMTFALNEESPSMNPDDYYDSKQMGVIASRYIESGRKNEHLR